MDFHRVKEESRIYKESLGPPGADKRYGHCMVGGGCICGGRTNGFTDMQTIAQPGMDGIFSHSFLPVLVSLHYN